MRYSKPCSVLIFLLTIPSLPAAPAQSQPIPSTSQKQVSPLNALRGVYRWSNGLSGELLKLLHDGKFSLTISGDAIGYNSTAHGRYVLEKGLLVLSPKYSIIETQPRARRITRLMVWNGDKLRLRPVTWGQRTYLLTSGKQEMEFCNAVNFGEEPTQASSWSIFFLRAGDEKKSVTGTPQLTAPWRKFLLESPIYTTILSVGKDSTAVIDAGEAEGLKIGMGLTNIMGIWLEPEFTVVSVKEHQATLRQNYPGVAIVHVGNRLSTRSPRYTEMLILN